VPISQQDRLLQIATPLGKDFLLLNKFQAQEGISSLFRFELDLLHEETEASSEPTVIDVKRIMGHPMVVGIEQRDNTLRYFSGIVSHFLQGNRDEHFTYYRAVLVPRLWLLTQRAQSRIYQHISVPDILKKVFEGLDVVYEIQGTFHPREYCVQYRETDFNFASRLMEEEGIYYYFEHTDKGHQMIVANTPLSHRECPSKSTVPFSLEISPQEDFVSNIDTWLVGHQLQTGKYTLWDHNFQLAHRNLEATESSRFNRDVNRDLEVFDFPGGYASRFDGIDKGGGAQASNLQKIFDDNRRTAKLRIEEIDASCQVISGSSNCASLTAGYRFTLRDHPVHQMNTPHTIVSVRHEADQMPNYVSERDNSDAYRNTFTCIPHGSGNAPYRPPSLARKPSVRGSQTAVVVGPPGEEIFVDKYGRVKVQFHWDRAGQADSKSSCWIRVAQNQAGLRWGAAYWPRIGQEVVVDFLEGDPDRPIIVGSVYNSNEMPPYTLPDEKSKTVLFKSLSYKGGGGFNEIRIEDKKGSEQIFINAEHNADVRIKNDRFETIGNESHLIVVKDQLEQVKGDKHFEVTGDHNNKVTGTLSLTVSQDVHQKVGSKYALESGTEIHLKSGTNLVIECGTTLTLKVGGNFININSGGIFIKGSMVMINSGGAAGSGSGANPEIPKKPKEADKAEPGSLSRPLPPSPPLPATTFSPLALVMLQAAQSGVPFCEICQNE
jgi:type VI secretion system secreted protein VgrG